MIWGTLGWWMAGPKVVVSGPSPKATSSPTENRFKNGPSGMYLGTLLDNPSAPDGETREGEPPRETCLWPKGLVNMFVILFAG